MIIIMVIIIIIVNIASFPPLMFISSIKNRDWTCYGPYSHMCLEVSHTVSSLDVVGELILKAWCIGTECSVTRLGMNVLECQQQICLNSHFNMKIALGLHYDILGCPIG